MNTDSEKVTELIKKIDQGWNDFCAKQNQDWVDFLDEMNHRHNQCIAVLLAFITIQTMIICALAIG